jgi:hypothetical protein
MNDLVVIEKIAQWEKLKMLVLDSVSSPITKRVYNMALNEFMAWFTPYNMQRTTCTLTALKTGKRSISGTYVSVETLSPVSLSGRTGIPNQQPKKR